MSHLRDARLLLRHSHGCYRWSGDGRCVDCGLYTGTPADVVRRISDGGLEFHLPARARGRSLYERLVGA
jgi:hypothetical protein